MWVEFLKNLKFGFNIFLKKKRKRDIVKIISIAAIDIGIKKIIKYKRYSMDLSKITTAFSFVMFIPNPYL